MRRVENIEGLELISHVPKSPSRSLPLLFVHGAFVAAWCWDEYFLPYFAKRGFAAHALSLRGHGGSAGHEMLSLASMDDYESDVLRVVRHIGEPVALIGHSMGGMVVQRCLSRVNAAAAVLMASVPPEGLFGSSLLLAARDPAVFQEINRSQSGHPSLAGLQGLRRMVFSEHLPEDDVVRHFNRMQPESQRATFDLSWPQHFLIKRAQDVPVLVLGAANDAFFPSPMVESTAQYHGVAAEFVPDMAHTMMLDPDWRKVARRIGDWLAIIRPGKKKNKTQS